MSEQPYRKAEPPKIVPGKIIQIEYCNDRMFALDDNGIIWYFSNELRPSKLLLKQLLFEVG